MARGRRIKESIRFLVVASLVVLTFLAQYAFRHFDDNRLTSWEWVFSSIKVTRILFMLVPGIIAAIVMSKTALPERYPVLFLFVLSLGTSVLFWREPEMIVDASRYFSQAKHLEVYGTGYFFREWGRAVPAWTDLPLIPFLYGLVFKCLGESRVYIQMFTTLMFSLTVLLTYLAGKELWGSETGFLGGMFMLGIPYVFTQVPLMLVDIPTMFFFLLAVFSFLRALETGGLWVPAASVTLFLTIFSKYSTWFFLSLLVVIAGVRLSRTYRVCGAMQAGRYRNRVVIPVVTSLLAAGVVIFLKYDVFSSQMALLLSYQKPGLRRWGESFVSTFLFQMHPFVAISAAVSVYTAWKKRDAKYLIISWLIVLIFAFQIRRIRYIMVAFPLLSLMAAYGLGAISDRNLKRYIVFSMVACSVILARFAFLPFLQHTSQQNLQSAGAFLDSLPGKTVEAVTLPRKGDIVNIAVNVPLLDLFTSKEIHYSYRLDYAPDAKAVAVSPLRFTWLYKNPGYYSVGPVSVDAVAVIAGEPEFRLPQEIIPKVMKFKQVKSFLLADDIFDHQTQIVVYY